MPQGTGGSRLNLRAQTPPPALATPRSDPRDSPTFRGARLIARRGRRVESPRRRSSRQPQLLPRRFAHSRRKNRSCSPFLLSSLRASPRPSCNTSRLPDIERFLLRRAGYSRKAASRILARILSRGPERVTRILSLLVLQLVALSPPPPLSPRYKSSPRSPRRLGTEKCRKVQLNVDVRVLERSAKSTRKLAASRDMSDIAG